MATVLALPLHSAVMQHSATPGVALVRNAMVSRSLPPMVVAAAMATCICNSVFESAMQHPPRLLCLQERDLLLEVRMLKLDAFGTS